MGDETSVTKGILWALEFLEQGRSQVVLELGGEFRATCRQVENVDGLVRFRFNQRHIDVAAVFSEDGAHFVEQAGAVFSDEVENGAPG